MIKIVTQDKALQREELAKATTYCAEIMGASESEIPDLIRTIECEIPFILEVGIPIK
ncbi:MAG: hypothetical protein KAI79_17210 [Bacteroidales bacterium]|nr:hypothetical protein [Bacteroidales bacterium]